MIHDSFQDHKNTSRGLRIGALGWQHANWLTDFYPEDLPEDWRLSYYANEFSAVLVPMADLLASDLDVSALIEDVPNDFEFYLLDDDTLNRNQKDAVLEQMQQAQLGGVISLAQNRLMSAAQYQQQVQDSAASQLWTTQQAGQSGVALVELGDQDLRRWRGLLEQFRADTAGNLHALFVSDQDIDMAALQQLKTLVELMGL